MDQQHDLFSSSPNSHTAHNNSGDTMATSLSGMTINDHHHGNQFHKENGIAVGLVRPGDCPMKGELASVGKQAPSSSRPHAAGTKIPAMTSAAKNGKGNRTSGHSSPGTPKSPASKAAGGKPPITGNEIKKVAVIRSTPKSPKNRSPTSLSAAAPLPDLKNIRSKVGSTDNLRHQPGGGRLRLRSIISAEINSLKLAFKSTLPMFFLSQVQILDQKVDFSNIQSKCGSKGNLRHVPGGGNVSIITKLYDHFKRGSLQFSC
uniref:Microtubule-associated protein n=1 Tax=Sinocyclocheilus rhinocerous TaxID=307959 RepID=A0A673MCX3_9TELE